MPSAYLSALGMMGRRHLKGLVRAGFTVVASDPNPEVFDIARNELVQAGLSGNQLLAAKKIPAAVDVAIFSETTLSRLGNLRALLSQVQVGRILLEKPISADPAEYSQFLEMARSHGVADRVQVNFIRRTWPHVQRLAEMCSKERHFSMTLNGGAIGLGCMGIHYIDTFMCLSGDERPDVRWATLSSETVKSGRGSQFQDFGGDFVLEGPRGCLLASLAADSSANVIMTVRGEHFMAELDYSEMHWKIERRKPESTLPFYRYGADYEVVEQGRMEIPAMDVVTEAWALGKVDLPTLEHALVTHRVLDEVLQAGGARPPYHFT